MTRPRPRHQDTSFSIGSDLRSPFDRGRDGPGGWRILIEPGIELPNTPEVAPNIAGWRRERLPSLPEDSAIQVVPDWVCEILSPTTRRHDLLIKKPRASASLTTGWSISTRAR
ncbi:Uma2 family endonuclease [Pendulispora albinea]|uniref:Uma2 family endonuclease n=1 Tax=Pendulispora albinea TaxID=2741071 RepID=A0ABZ2MCY9_9BACT